MSNIIGLGIDPTDIPRIADTIERYGDRFVHRIFTENEVAYCRRRRVPALPFAGRFRAQEGGNEGAGPRALAGCAVARGRDRASRRAAATPVARRRRP